MLENTIDNKVRFFMNYMYAPYKQANGVESTVSSLSFPKEVAAGESYLILRHLSVITDEDAIEVADILDISSLYDFRKRKAEVLSWLNNAWQPGKCGIQWSILEIFDFLRSRGYLLPFMGLPVEKIIEYGWVKID